MDSNIFGGKIEGAVIWEATKRLLKEERHFSVSQLQKAKEELDRINAKIDAFKPQAGPGASEEVQRAIDEAVAPIKADLRDTFASAIREVKSLTEEAIATANRQAASVSTSIEAREKTAVSLLLTEAQRYGA